MTYPWSGQSRRTMTATPAEFGNSLKAAFPGAVAEDECGFVLTQSDASLRFDVVIESPLRIGILTLPRMLVSVTVLAGTADAAFQLLETVDRATQRGGG